MRLFGKLKKEHWNELLGILLVIIAIWMLVSIIGYGGSIGDRLGGWLKHRIGYISYLLALVIGYWGVSFFIRAEKGILSGFFGSVCLLLSGLMLPGLFTSETSRVVGLIGDKLDSLCIRWIGTPGLLFAGLIFLILGVVLSSELTFRSLIHAIHNGFKKLFTRRKEPVKPEGRVKKVKDTEGKSPAAAPIIIFDSSGKQVEDGMYLRQPSAAAPYVVPPLSLLDKAKPDNEELTRDILQETARILERSFDDFGIDARVLRVNRGPVITRYEVEPGPGVKVSKFVSLSDDLALVLRALRVRVVAPVPGEGVIGIEVPNERIAQVGLREVLESSEFRNTRTKIPLPLGKDISGKPFVADLAEMPHLLIAGTTGSGKSVFLNSVIASMLFRMTPNELRLLMIDPKRVELNAYDGIPHLIAPVVTESMKAPGYLKWALKEVDGRYKRMANLGVRNINGYNKYIQDHPEVAGTKIEPDHLIHGRLPYIIIIIDELADLMLVDSSEVEALITRLAQIARAAGVHILVSTQRPSVNVVTGSIKANLPCRLSFRLASKVDSRTILDMNGAENLLGKGDMLFLDMNSAKPVRIQGCYIDEAEIERLVDFIKQHAPRGETEIFNVDVTTESAELYEEAVRLVLKHRTASTSFLQRKLNISYDRSVQIMEDMEINGVIGPDIEGQPREILMDHPE